MIILVIGSGLMGPAAAYNALTDPAIDRVILADREAEKLELAAAKLRSFEQAEKLDIRTVDLSDRDAAVALMREANVVLTALPWKATVLAVDAALAAGIPLVDLAIPDDDEMARMARRADEAGGFILLGCGLEPGLTEIEARHLAQKLDVAEEFHIMVGGIPEKPTGPMGYKIVFGGDELPLRYIDAMVVEGGQPKQVRRYSGNERVSFEGVGECEAWNEGVIPWLLDLPEFQEVKEATQKTIRWPGYAEKATVLNDLGLLSTDPVEVHGTPVTPKAIVDTLLRPHVTMREEDRDITLFRVDIIGRREGKRVRLRTEMIDRYDETLGFTSMARTTAFTGAIIARMIAKGEVKGNGLMTPDLLLTGEKYETLMQELASAGVNFSTSEDILEEP